MFVCLCICKDIFIFIDISYCICSYSYIIVTLAEMLNRCWTDFATCAQIDFLVDNSRILSARLHIVPRRKDSSMSDISFTLTTFEPCVLHSMFTLCL